MSPHQKAGLWALFLIILTPSLSNAQNEKERRKDFARLNQSSSLLWDSQVIRRFAAVQKPDILPRLLNAYLKPPTAPQKQLRYLLATEIGNHQRSSLNDKQLKVLLGYLGTTTSSDATIWGSYQGFRALTHHQSGTKKLETIVRESKRPYLRVAALEALGHSGSGTWVIQLPTWIKRARETRSKTEKILVLEALAWTTARVGHDHFAKDKRKKDDDMNFQQFKDREMTRLAVDAIINCLDDLALFPRTKREISLALQHCFDSDKAHTNSSAWHRLLYPESTRREGSTVQRIPVRFMTLAGLGDRYLFLLDASDSMLTPLTDSEKRALFKILPKNKDKDGKTVERSKKKMKRRVTRFDAARLHLASTLRSMDEKHEFAIVLFGDQGELFTPGFVSAKSVNVKKTISSLFSIRVGAPKELRPDGTLKGNTNLYSAFQVAFQVGSAGIVASPESSVESRLLFEGADTIFLLSDGAPTEDGFKGSTPPIKRKAVITYGGGGGRYDKETGKSSGGGNPRPMGKLPPPVEITEPIKHENGPYLQASYLVDEIRRLNFTRRTIIHVVNIGEARDQISRAIAKAGRGQFVRIGE